MEAEPAGQPGLRVCNHPRARTDLPAATSSSEGSWTAASLVHRTVCGVSTCHVSLVPTRRVQALDDFVTLWSEYDDGSGTIAPRALEELLLRLDPPLGLGPYADNKDVLRWVYWDSGCVLGWGAMGGSSGGLCGQEGRPHGGHSMKQRMCVP